MLKNFAKFTATIKKGLNVGDTDVEVKLLVPLKAVQENFMFLSTNQGEKINVFLGDPQAALDFGDDEDAMYQKFTGRYVTTDSSGVVTKVENLGGQDDENQPDLFDQGSELEGDSSFSETEGETPEGEGDPDPDQAGSGIDEEVPDWMTDGDGGGEMDFTDDGGQQDPDDPEDELTDYEREILGESVAEISKEALEEYIISQAPTFEDIPFDFPALLKQRKEESKTWMQIAKEAGVPSSQISSKYSAYKKRVEKLMRDGGAA
ncbi:hypothetical protein [Paenibacillus brevis]|uniref:Uncharacterized protein n=1 Tax=Paenibacillus brevis TaxID=2841508 RepID=A0ABS6FTA8_9BACL|nr:hypothetical protein [Paenibacillus brevis]MBU5673219.1 hypothetical protein [Paenibacillus brevis]